MLIVRRELFWYKPFSAKQISVVNDSWGCLSAEMETIEKHFSHFSDALLLLRRISGMTSGRERDV